MPFICMLFYHLPINSERERERERENIFFLQFYFLVKHHVQVGKKEVVLFILLINKHFSMDLIKSHFAREKKKRN